MNVQRSKHSFFKNQYFVFLALILEIRIGLLPNLKVRNKNIRYLELVLNMIFLDTLILKRVMINLKL